MTGVEIPPAYIDPGAGSMIIQVIIGTLLAAPFVLRRQLGRAWEALRRRRPGARSHRGHSPAPR
jgi:hypothetical protein